MNTNKRKARVLKKNAAKKSNAMTSSASRSAGPPRAPRIADHQYPSSPNGSLTSPSVNSQPPLSEYYMERYGNLNSIICKVNRLQ